MPIWFEPYFFKDPCQLIMIHLLAPFMILNKELVNLTTILAQQNLQEYDCRLEKVIFQIFSIRYP